MGLCFRPEFSTPNQMLRISDTMLMGIFSRRIKFVFMVSMLNRRDFDAAFLQFLHEFHHEFCLAVVLPPNDVHSFHGVSRWCLCGFRLCDRGVT